MIRKIISGLRAADVLNFAFLLFLAAVSLVFRERISGAPILIATYSALFILQAAVILTRDRGIFYDWVYDLLFPTFSILVVFDSLGRLVHYINPNDIDPILIKTDYILFAGNPTVIMEKIMSPFLTDILQLAYSSYYFLPVTLGIVLKMKNEDSAFERSLFMIMLCFYLSYIGYMLWPALGPRFTINHLQGAELKGFLITQPLQELLNRIEGVKRDAFPSGHTGIALTVLYLAYRFERRLFKVFLPFVLALIFSTVYLRYHYVVDVIGGVFLALITLLLGETYYGYRAERINTDS